MIFLPKENLRTMLPCLSSLRGERESVRRSINSILTVYTLQTAPNELSTRTSDLHYQIPEKLQV